MIEQPQQEFKKSRKEGRHHGIHGQQIVKQCNVVEPTKLHSCRCEDVIIVDNIADIGDNDIWLKMSKVTLHIGDRKQLTMIGSPLNDKHISCTDVTKTLIS